MRSISVQRTIPAPRPAVWAVLADFPHISEWNSGVAASHATSESTGGVGATRHCDLAPMGALEETIAEWVPDERLVITIDHVAKLPIKHGNVTFSLEPTDDDASTTVTIDYAYRPKLSTLLGPVLDRQLTKGMTGFLADLDTASQAADEDRKS